MDSMMEAAIEAGKISSTLNLLLAILALVSSIVALCVVWYANKQLKKARDEIRNKYLSS